MTKENIKISFHLACYSKTYSLKFYMKKTILTILLFLLLFSVPLKGVVSDKDYITTVIPNAAKTSFVIPSIGAGAFISLGVLRIEIRHKQNIYEKPFLPDKVSHFCDSYIADFWFVPVSGAGALLEGLKTDRYYEPFRYMVASHTINLGFTYALKWGIRRTRPDETPLSFPSGHTSIAFTTATLWYNWHGPAAGIPMYSLAFVTALSRINDKRHRPADVIFGAVLGTVTGRALYLSEKNEKKKQSFTPVIPVLEIRFSTADWDW